MFLTADTTLSTSSQSESPGGVVLQNYSWSGSAKGWHPGMHVALLLGRLPAEPQQCAVHGQWPPRTTA